MPRGHIGANFQMIIEQIGRHTFSQELYEFEDWVGECVGMHLEDMID